MNEANVVISRSMDQEILALENEVVSIGQLVELAISRAITALVHRDTLLAKSVVSDDYYIDHAEVQLQEHCVSVLENARPVGSELRFVIAVLKINDSLERIGDLAENVAAIIADVGDWERFTKVGGLNELAEMAQQMVNQSLSALIHRDTELAHKVIRQDDKVDASQKRILEKIEYEIDRIPENAPPLMRLEHVTRQFERIGDISCNIAEEVIYLVDGEIVRHRV